MRRLVWACFVRNHPEDRFSCDEAHFMLILIYNACLFYCKCQTNNIYVDWWLLALFYVDSYWKIISIVFGCLTKRDSNQSPQLQRLARKLKFPSKQVNIWYFPVSEQYRCWSVCVDAQAGLRLCRSQPPRRQVFLWLGPFHVDSHLQCFLILL